MAAVVPNIAWTGDAAGRLRLLDQTRLPGLVVEVEVATPAEVAAALRSLVVRGAPAIGIAAAYGVVLATPGAPAGLWQRVRAAVRTLAASRPTAVNLFAALDRQTLLADRLEHDGAAPPEAAARLLAEARAIHDEDAACCAAIGRAGADLVEDGMRVLTHCNTGRLATGGIGTALGILTTAARAGKKVTVYVNETRPLLQGARLTAFELREAGIGCTLLADAAGPGLIGRGEIDAVVVGADRIAANGDTANKVGTLPLALAARHFGIPFYVAAPTTTIDPGLASGRDIPVEERAAGEILDALGPDRVPAGVAARNPAFDVTPAALVRALVTERGLLHDPGPAGIKELLGNGR